MGEARNQRRRQRKGVRWFGAWREGGPADHAGSPLIEPVEALLADPMRPRGKPGQGFRRLEAAERGPCEKTDCPHCAVWEVAQEMLTDGPMWKAGDVSLLWLCTTCFRSTCTEGSGVPIAPMLDMVLAKHPDRPWDFRASQ